MLRVKFSAERLKGAVVRVGPNSNRNDPTCDTISLAQIQANQEVEVTCDLYGRYLSIDIPGDRKTLTICEVQVFTGQCEGNIVVSLYKQLNNNGWMIKFAGIYYFKKKKKKKVSKVSLFRQN